MDPILIIFMIIALLVIALFALSVILLLIKPFFKTANIVVSLLMMIVSLFALGAFQLFFKDKQFKSASVAFFIFVVYMVMPVLLLTLKNPEEEEMVVQPTTQK